MPNIYQGQKNTQVKNFLDSMGMHLLQEDINSGVKTYQMDVNDFSSEQKINIEVI